MGDCHPVEPTEYAAFEASGQIGNESSCTLGLNDPARVEVLNPQTHGRSPPTPPPGLQEHCAADQRWAHAHDHVRHRSPLKHRMESKRRFHDESRERGRSRRNGVPQSSDVHVLLPRRSTPLSVPLEDRPVRVVGQAGNHIDVMASAGQSRCESLCVRSISARLRRVVHPDDLHLHSSDPVAFLVSASREPPESERSGTLTAFDRKARPAATPEVRARKTWPTR